MSKKIVSGLTFDSVMSQFAKKDTEKAQFGRSEVEFHGVTMMERSFISEVFCLVLTAVSLQGISMPRVVEVLRKFADRLEEQTNT